MEAGGGIKTGMISHLQKNPGEPSGAERLSRQVLNREPDTHWSVKGISCEHQTVVVLPPVRHWDINLGFGTRSFVKRM